MTRLQPLDPLSLQRRLEEDSAVLIDIREPDEYARESIPGARLVPMSALGHHDFSEELKTGKALVFHCKGGNRTTICAPVLMAKGCAGAYVLTGGIESCKRAGLPVRTGR